MLVAWNLPVTRPTRDIDMLACVQNDLDRVRQVIAEVCRVRCEDDGLFFTADSVTTERIAEDALYEGVRAKFNGSLGNARIAMQIDLGFSDVITPGSVDLAYPTILDQPSPHLKAYNRETTIAEKCEAMVKLGELNSRMKDFFDIWSLAQSASFDGAVLSEAVAHTFERRNTPKDGDAVCFSEAFGSSPDKQKQWQAFVKRSQLVEHVPEAFRDVWHAVTQFLKPMLADSALALHWPPGGPWSGQTTSRS